MIKQFFAWWFGELSSLLARKHRSNARDAGPRIRLALDGEQLRVSTMGMRSARAPQTVRRDDAPRVAETIARVASGLDPTRTRCEVTVNSDQVLVRDVTLPLAAEENLREVLGFEMDRQTPFRAQDVYYDFHVLSRDRARAQIRVRLKVVRRILVEPLINCLSHWSLQAVSGDGGGVEDESRATAFLFAPDTFRVRQPGMVNGVLVALVVLLLAVLAYLPYASQRDLRKTLDVQLEQARVQAAATIKLRDALDARNEAVDVLNDARQQRPAMVELLEVLSEVLPDHTYLARLEVRRDEVTMQGVSRSASSLIGLLEGEQRLTDVQFASQVTRDPRSGNERFHISARVVAVTKP